MLQSTLVGPSGAPGIYPQTPRAVQQPGSVRLDACAFVGVAPRGPVRVVDLGEDNLPLVGQPRRRSTAVAVDSFDQYRRLYGGFEGPGRLPFAVASFFEQGGRRAYVVRVVHHHNDPADELQGVALGDIAGLHSASGVAVRARNEGSWGNRLRAAASFALQPLTWQGADVEGLWLEPHAELPAGSLLRFDLGGGQYSLRFVASRRAVPGHDGPGERLRLQLAAPLASPPLSAQVVLGNLLVEEMPGVDNSRRESFSGLGLSPLHPRFLAAVLWRESELVEPHPAWQSLDLIPVDPSLPSEPDLQTAQPFDGGEDRYEDLVAEDFFDPAWPSMAVGAQMLEPGEGVQAVVGLEDLGALVVPDLYVPEALPQIEQVVSIESFAGPDFAACVQAPAAPTQADLVPALAGLFLDPRSAADRAAIQALQQRLLGFAEVVGRFVALLEAPPGLTPTQVLAWRSNFASSYAAAYHPWLWVDRHDDLRRERVLLGPAAAVAGLMARRELEDGVLAAPAGELRQVLDLREPVSTPWHDRFHPQGLNVVQRQAYSIEVSAARTLSPRRQLRQLSVRRFLIWLRRVLEEQMAWLVFEANGPALRVALRQQLVALLRPFYLNGYLRGDSEQEAFQVRCDTELNPPGAMEAGRLVAEVRVAPAEPLEFILLRFERVGDGTLVLEV